MNRVLRDKSNEANELAVRLRTFESDAGKYTVEIKEVTRRLSSSSEEIERLTREKQMLERRVNDLGSQASKLSQYESEI